MNPIIPTIFARNKKEFLERFRKLLPISKNIQIDFMDGKFVKSKSVQLFQVPNLKKYKKNFEAHLMTLNPENQITKLKQKGFRKIIFHISSTKTPEKVINKIKQNKLEPWIAINPNISINKLTPIIKNIKGVLFMGVRPGKEKQSFISTTYKRISEFKKLNPKIKTQVDGGVNPKVAKTLANLGVDYINSGSYISISKNPKEQFKKLNNLFKQSRK